MDETLEYEFPKTVYAQPDRYDGDEVWCTDINLLDRCEVVATYQLVSVGIAETKISKNKAVKK